jgi:hypothetical protein
MPGKVPDLLEFLLNSPDNGRAEIASVEALTTS